MSRRSVVLSTVFLVAAGCDGFISRSGPGSEKNEMDAGPGLIDSGIEFDAGLDAGEPWEAVGPAVYVPRLKSVLTGLAATQTEIESVVANPDALAGLIDAWFLTPESDARWLEFFANAFQQNQVTWDMYMDQFGYFGGLGNLTSSQLEPLMLQQLSESFPRTALHFVKTGQPFTKTLNTRSFMMTVPMEVLLTYSDTQHVPDAADPELTNGRNKFNARNPNFRFELHQDSGVTLAQTLTVGGPQFMKWNSAVTRPADAMLSLGCSDYPLMWANAPGMYDGPGGNSAYLQAFMFGRIVHPNRNCVLVGGGVWTDSPRRTQFTAQDWSTWKMVTVRQPGPGEATTAFYDVPFFRTSNEILTDTPRVGFFTTPAFFANWATNTSNLARVAINQTLIVAMGKSFDGTKSIQPISEEALDGVHASSPVCYGCHQTLDPMRQFFRRSYTLHYHEQDVDAGPPGQFAFDGVTRSGDTIYNLADVLAEHPRFAVAWAQKLCLHLNSLPCDELDPVFQRAVQAFRDDGYKFQTLVRTLYSSDVATLAAPTRTFRTNRPVVTLIRKEQLCAALSHRLNLPDFCGSRTVALSAAQLAAARLAPSLPGVAFSRGAEAPSLPLDPTLFYRLGTEQLCTKAAEQVVDVANSPFQSTQPSVALDRLMSLFLQLQPGDGRYGGARAVLEQHLAVAGSADAGPTTQRTALLSTFVLACLAPANTGSGM